MRAIEYRIKQKGQNLGDSSPIESRISRNFFIEYRIRDPRHPAPLITIGTGTKCSCTVKPVFKGHTD